MRCGRGIQRQSNHNQRFRTKNHKHRQIPITDEIRDVLDRIRLIQEKYGKTEDYVFSNGNTPFCTLLFIEDRHQRQGFGRLLMEYWEKDMRMKGYGMVLTSTQVDEEAQHFYRKLGYKDCGGFTVDVPGYEQPMELIMVKQL